METRLVKLKSDFNNIINIRNGVKNVFDILQVRIDKLTTIYSEFIKTNKSDLFVFGLDSLHFQSKLIDIEYEDMKRLFLVINNRMYCEYFKLHKIIIDYITKNINDKKTSDLVKINNFPVYKDLEPFREYKFEIILDIHENILNLLGVLISILNNKENELSIHKIKQNIGLNIDNFITSFNFNINVIREKIVMFITYIEFFHKMHSKYLKRFSNKIQLMYTHINNDIKFDDSIEISKNKKKELIDDFVTNNMDKDLLNDLKTSIGSETNSEVSVMTPKTYHEDKIDIFDTYKHENIRTDYIREELSPACSDISKLHNSSFANQIGPESTVSTLIDKPEKKDLKKIFQKNVHKLTGILSLTKQNKNIMDESKITEQNIDSIFMNIEQSCDSIINNSEDNFGINLESVENSNNKYHTEQFTDINYQQNLDSNTSIGENKNIEDINTNPNTPAESVEIQDDNIVGEEATEMEPIKKKRVYNKKKK